MKLITGLLALALILLMQASQGPHSGKVSEHDVNSVIQAVEDEIYDYGYQKHFYQMGESVNNPPDSSSVRMQIYIAPELDKEKSGGRAIYKLMPYGEVIREFTIRKDGLVVLGGNPQNGFPPTQESNTKTVYMDDDEVCKLGHDWLKRFFVVRDSPGADMIQEAVRRQKLRIGFSDWEYKHVGVTHP